MFFELKSFNVQIAFRYFFKVLIIYFCSFLTSPMMKKILANCSLGITSQTLIFAVFDGVVFQA